jgi:acyl dehydratase
MILVGETIGPLIGGPVTRQLLVEYAGASGDSNPLHLDIDYARAAGRDDVIAQGMLTMAWLSRMLVERFDPGALCRLETRFLAPTPVHATVRCLGQVTTVARKGDLTLVGIDLRAELDDGTISACGTAECVIPSED